MGLFGDVFGLAVATSVDIYNEEKKRIAQEQRRIEKETADMAAQRNQSINSDIMFAKTLISVWVYTFESDGSFKNGGEEFKFFKKLCDDLILGEDKKIFLDVNLTDEELDEYEEIILDAIEKPLPISEIKSFTKGDNEFRLALLEQAIWCAQADEVVEKAELKFLKDLAKELRISALDRNLLFKKYEVTA
jgi:uncharacterized membrane protein YebE (DUF533 family)